MSGRAIPKENRRRRNDSYTSPQPASARGSSASQTTGNVDARMYTAGRDIIKNTSVLSLNVDNPRRLPDLTDRQPSRNFSESRRIPDLTNRHPNPSFSESRRIPDLKARQFNRQTTTWRRPSFNEHYHNLTNLTLRSSSKSWLDTAANECSSFCPFCEGKDVQIREKDTRIESLEAENKSLKQSMRYAWQNLLMNVPLVAVHVSMVMLGFSIWASISAIERFATDD